MERTRRARLLLILIVSCQIALCLHWGFAPQDDAYISFRYARNLVEGHGLVFNPGERVEGYTNFSWTMLAAGVMALGFSPEIPMILAGILGACLLTLGAHALGETRRTDGTAAPALALAAPAFVAANLWMSVEAVQGLETTAFGGIVTWLVWQRLREDGSEEAFPWSGVLGGLAALTRPEGYLAFALVEGIALAHHGIGSWKTRVVPAVLFAAVTLPHLAFRLAYYGDIVPNTMHAKVGMTPAQLARGIAYVGEYGTQNPVLFLLAALGGWALVRTRPDALRSRMLVGIPVAYLAYVALVGGDYKLTGRFVIPVLGLLAALAQEGVLATGRTTGRVGLAGILTVLFLLAADQKPQYDTAAEAVRFRALETQRGIVVGTWLKAHVPEHTMIASHSVGILPYVSRLPTIDMLGLTDAHIANVEVGTLGRGVAGHEKTDYAYVFSQTRLRIYVPSRNLLTKVPTRLHVSNEFPENFEERWRQVSVKIPEGWINLFVRSDLPVPWETL